MCKKRDERVEFVICTLRKTVYGTSYVRGDPMLLPRNARSRSLVYCNVRTKLVSKGLIMGSSGFPVTNLAFLAPPAGS